MKKYLSLILICIGLTVSKADNANWKIHPIFDEEVSHVVETPDYVYFTSRNMQKNTKNETFFSLFRYDKKGDELLPLSTTNFLNGNNISDIIYNPDKGYLGVVYVDHNIDLIQNNGKVINIPYYKQATLSNSKKVNSISVDPSNDRLYLATDFGYVAINDKKAEVAESRIYGTPLSAFARMGDVFLAVEDDRLIFAETSAPRLSLNQYLTITFVDGAQSLHPLNDNLCLIVAGEGNVSSVHKISRESNGDFRIEPLFSGTLFNVENNPTGITIAASDAFYHIAKDGTLTRLSRPGEYANSAAGSENLSEIWNGEARKGLSSVKHSGETWSLTRDWMLPNAPASFASSSFIDHPDLGTLALGYGYREATLGYFGTPPLQLCAYKQGRWKNLAPIYTNPSRGHVLMSPTGMVQDQNNRNYLYITSYRNGIMRLNLTDPEDIIHLSVDNDVDKGNPGFEILPPTQINAKGFWNQSPPGFDKQGNLWINFSNWDDQTATKAYFYCWKREDLLSLRADNINVPDIIAFDVPFARTNRNTAIPLIKTGTGLIVITAGLYDDRMALIDTKGTPTNTNDDQVYVFPNFTDTDGNRVEVENIRFLWEDPNTGYVWIGHANGLCYFVPSKVLAGDYSVTRVKVSRNDGTNLADYLLEGVAVNNMVSDGEGRKWFATSGGGVVCTSSDGREILEEFNASNSPLPDDVVLGLGYDTSANSLMIATNKGYAEYSLPASQSSSSKADIKAYPNPVRPDYSGYVTITDIPQGSFVKIVDAGGNLVKELGVMSGFEMLWDVSDSNFNRVKSGVYHIMVSPSDENGKYNAVGKILVVS